ncbi:MAG: trypsin-like peptidase domain-containing protein [Ardenticatenales bacterium]|nr:trypsin-like peptidase domain-containing protein [Ardenticatenales bacterium]
MYSKLALPPLQVAPSASTELAALVERIRPGVVQIGSGERGVGAGIIWQTNGTILTNHHVVAHKQGPLQIHLTDGRVFEATVIAQKPSFDLALLQIEADGLPALPIGNSAALRVGEWVFAIGHPWGEGWRVTAGIVSGLGTVRGSESDGRIPYIRSDVLLRPGNSGGPLLNAHGEVIGINSMIFGGDLSIAIPAHVAHEWSSRLNTRTVTLTLEVQPVALPAHGKGAIGLLVTGLAPDGCSDALLLGDILLDIAGEEVADADSLRETLSQHHPQATVAVRLLRGGVPQQVGLPLSAFERLAA